MPGLVDFRHNGLQNTGIVINAEPINLFSYNRLFDNEITMRQSDLRRAKKRKWKRRRLNERK